MDSASQLAPDVMVCQVVLMEVMKLAAVSFKICNLYYKYLDIMQPQLIINYFSALIGSFFCMSVILHFKHT